jgi:hypothetical protein
MAVEIHDPRIWTIHEDIEYSVDRILQGNNLPLQKREFIESEQSTIRCKISQFQKKTNNVVEHLSKRSLNEKKQKKQ